MKIAVKIKPPMKKKGTSVDTAVSSPSVQPMNQPGLRCSACGAANSTQDQFCGSCGATLAVATTCQNCGALSDTRDAFCGSCGTPIGKIRRDADIPIETPARATALSRRRWLIGMATTVLLVAVGFGLWKWGGKFWTGAESNIGVAEITDEIGEVENRREEVPEPNPSSPETPARREQTQSTQRRVVLEPNPFFPETTSFPETTGGIVVFQSDIVIEEDLPTEAERQTESPNLGIKIDTSRGGMPPEVLKAFMEMAARRQIRTEAQNQLNQAEAAEEEPPDFVRFEIAPAIAKWVQPIYPEIARKNGLEGTVWVKLWVNKEGRVKQAVIQNSSAEIFDQPALQAAKQCLFTPAMMQNRPVEMWIAIPFYFRLK